MPERERSQREQIKHLKEMIRINESNLSAMRGLVATLEETTQKSKSKKRGGAAHDIGERSEIAQMTRAEMKMPDGKLHPTAGH